MKYPQGILVFLSSIVFVACSSPSSHSDTDSIATIADTSIPEITLEPAYVSPEFPDAILELNSPLNGAKLKKGEQKFLYNIKNYALAQPTSGMGADHCANSDEGQHIHFILNNQPYTAHYAPEITKQLDEGSYVLLSFLSRSYHESIKSPDAYTLIKFTVGKALPDSIDLNAAHMFYSRPKGEYVGNDTREILLDFFLVNTVLGKDTNQVKLTIDGSTIFNITEWKAYLIKGLSMGEHILKLELLDKKGNPVPGPYNVVERKIILKESLVQ